MKRASWIKRSASSRSIVHTSGFEAFCMKMLQLRMFAYGQYQIGLSGVMVPFVQEPPPVASSEASATDVSHAGIDVYNAFKKEVVNVLSTQTCSSEIELKSSLSSMLEHEDDKAKMAAHVINIFFISNYSNN